MLGKYRNWITTVTNDNIGNPRQCAKLRIILVKIQVQLKHENRNGRNARLTYNLNDMRQCGEFLTSRDIKIAQNRNINTKITDTDKYWQKL